MLGPGTIYLKQTIKFKAPLYVDQPFTAKVEVLRVWERRKMAELSTVCLADDGTKLVDGTALVQTPSLPPTPVASGFP